MSFQRIQTTKRYMGASSSRPISLVPGDTYFSTDTDELHMANLEGVLVSTRGTGGSIEGYFTTGSIENGDLVVSIGDVARDRYLTINTDNSTMSYRGSRIEMFNAQLRIYENIGEVAFPYSNYVFDGVSIKDAENNLITSYKNNRIQWFDTNNTTKKTRIEPSTIFKNVNLLTPKESGTLALDSQITILRTKVSLTAAQLKSLDTTEVVAIPNPGVGKFIKMHSTIWSFVWGTAPFDAVTLRLSQTCDNYVTAPFTLDRTSDMLRDGDFYSSTDFCPNSNVTVSANSDSVLTGDSTVDVYISYEIVTL